MQTVRRALYFLNTHHLPIGLTLAIILGSLFPSVGLWVSGLSFPVSSLSVALIFFVQGLKLETREARDALTSVRAVVYGLPFILLISPTFAWPLVQLSPLEPIELTLGMALFLTLPTTISTGAVLTKQAYGNTSLAVLLSVSSTLLGLLIVPFTIQQFALSQASIELDTMSLLLNLCLTVLVPLILGKLIRDFVPRAQQAIQATNSATKYASSVAMIMVPWLQISKSADAIRNLSFVAIFSTCGVGLIVHVLLLGINWLVCRFGSGLLKLDLAKQKAVIIACSGKTVAIGIAVLPMLDYDDDKKGLMAVPLVIAHLIQTIMDSLIANQWCQMYEAEHPNETRPNCTDSDPASSFIEKPATDASSVSLEPLLVNSASQSDNEKSLFIAQDEEKSSIN